MSTRRTPVRERVQARGRSQAALYLPDPSLSGVVLAYLSRRTRGAGARRTADRWNYFPPVPAFVFLWVLDGHDSRLDEAGPGGTAAPRAVFSGPHVRPSFSVNPGPARFFTMLMYPDALRSIAGLPVEPHVGRYLPVRACFDADWCRMAEQVAAAVDDPARISVIERFLAARLPGTAAVPVQPTFRRGRLAVWSGDLDRRARGARLTPRQSGRRIKAWTGMTLRHLRGIARMEHALLEVQAMGHSGRGWSSIAAECGFADQAHLCREFRRHLGMRPTEMARNLSDESCWVLQLWA